MGRGEVVLVAGLLSVTVLTAAGCGSEEAGPPDMSPIMGTAGSGAAAGSPALAGSPASTSGTAGAMTTAAAGSGGGAAGSPRTAGSMSPAAAGSGGVPAAGGGTGGAGSPAAGSGGSAGAAGSSGSSGAGGMDAMAGSGGAGPMSHEDLGQGDGKDVITIGDSWMSLFTTGIQQSLEKVSGRDYRNYGVPGTLVLNEQIPNQYVSAVREDPDIKTVVMTGGGNDILTSSCSGEACRPTVDQVSERLNELMMEMAMDGVQDVILIGYTYPSDMSKHDSLDYSRMISNMICTTTRMPRCHFIDSTKLDLTLMDGIHPNAAGYDLIGKTVWELMKAEGVRR